MDSVVALSEEAGETLWKQCYVPGIVCNALAFCKQQHQEVARPSVYLVCRKDLNLSRILSDDVKRARVWRYEARIVQCDNCTKSGADLFKLQVESRVAPCLGQGLEMSRCGDACSKPYQLDLDR
jgi:hypothetical protein